MATVSADRKPVHWAARSDFGSEAHPLSQATEAARSAGRAFVDLTESNPTRCGLSLDAESLLGPLNSQDNLTYAAEPFGPMAAREAIASGYYGARTIAVDARHMLLTASTSEAYSYLLRLFCEPGDEILVPQPSYPLFDLLAQLHDVRLVPYPLRFHEHWEADLHALESRIGERTRAIVVVHPNNPTGHFAVVSERLALQQLAARYGLALIVDEVFLDYPIESAPATDSRSFLHDQSLALTFVLSGLSKVLALPQMKVAWTTVAGPDADREQALHRLEFIADTFLSVAAPAANALSKWLSLAAGLQTQLLARVRKNLAVLDSALQSLPLVSRLPVQAGWSAVLRVPAVGSDVDLALRALSAHGVLVHPGSFFGFPDQGWLVLSLLPATELFADGIARLLNAINQSVTDEPLQ